MIYQKVHASPINVNVVQKGNGNAVTINISENEGNSTINNPEATVNVSQSGDTNNAIVNLCLIGKRIKTLHNIWQMGNVTTIINETSSIEDCRVSTLIEYG
jgi:hypothetical protein